MILLFGFVWEVFFHPKGKNGGRSVFCWLVGRNCFGSRQVFVTNKKRAWYPENTQEPCFVVEPSMFFRHVCLQGFLGRKARSQWDLGAPY